MLDFALTCKGPCLAIANNVLAFCSVPLVGLVDSTPNDFYKIKSKCTLFLRALALKSNILRDVLKV